VRAFIVLACLLILSQAVWAEVPPIISYQGRLTDSLGIALEGEYTLIFSIYDLPEEGDLLWSSGPRAIGVSDGLFSCNLGEMTPIPDSVFMEHFERWLGIAIQGQPEMSPRILMTSSAFSYRSRFADYSGSAETSGHAEHATVADDAMDAGHAMYADTADYAFAATGGGGGWVDGGSKVYLADSTAYVGIGTSNPYAELEIYSTGEPDLILTRKTSSSAAFIGFRTGSLFDWSLYTPSGGDALYIDKNDWGTVFSCLQNGNVGIGTIQPAHKLTVDKGNILVRGTQEWGDSGDTAKLILGDPNHGLAAIYGQGLSMWTYGDGKHDIKFGSHSGSDFMIIGATGRIAINTLVDPSSRLLVEHTSGQGQVAIHGRINVSNGSSGGGIGVRGKFDSDGVGGVGVYGGATSGSDLGGLAGVYGFTDDTNSYAVYADGAIGSTGPISSVIETKTYGLRETYAVHSAGNWCEDFGSQTTVDGVARVSIDPVFAETVRLDRDYHIFLTPLGDCGLYVAEKHADYFVVRAHDGKTCSIAFDYRIVAKRIGFEDKRLRAADKIKETTSLIHHLENQENSE